MNSRVAKYSWRVYPLWLLLLCAAAALLWRLLQLQGIGQAGERTFLQQQGDARILRDEVILASRGEITDRHGVLLAFSTPVKSLWVDPSLFPADKESVVALSAALDMPPSALRQRLQSNDQFVYLRRQLDPQRAAAVLDLNLRGVFSKTEYRRFYPAGEVAAHLVGFTDIDERGQEGLELAYDSQLRAEPGRKQVMKNARGEVIKDIRLLQPARAGESLALSIDMQLQYAAYRELKAAVANYRAQSGSLVILDVDTGEVLALVNQPSYNANDRRQLVAENMRNRALIDLFEPGSVVKPFTIAAALLSGKFLPHSRVETAPGKLRVGSKVISDQSDYGELDLAGVLHKSSNVATSKIALDLDIEQMRQFFASVGLAEHCATGFPGESVGFLPSHRPWQPIQRATLSFGHGLTVNAVQLARAYATIAGNGIKRPVSLTRLDGSVAVTGERVMSAKVARSLREMMIGVVEAGGTGVAAAIPGYSVAGKTGTAHKVGDGGYQSHRYRATFAGMVPAHRPRLVAVVTIDDPRGDKYFGGEIAAPVFSRVMRAALRSLNVPPDRLQELAGPTSQRQGSV